MESSYTVTGMTCSHCVRHVTEEVSAISGVQQVTVSLETGRMVVVSEAPLDLATVTAAVAEAGDYTVASA